MDERLGRAGDSATKASLVKEEAQIASELGALLSRYDFLANRLSRQVEDLEAFVRKLSDFRLHTDLAIQELKREPDAPYTFRDLMETSGNNISSSLDRLENILENFNRIV